jgi:hypothetical protein
MMKQGEINSHSGLFCANKYTLKCFDKNLEQKLFTVLGPYLLVTNMTCLRLRNTFQVWQLLAKKTRVMAKYGNWYSKKRKCISGKYAKELTGGNQASAFQAREEDGKAQAKKSGDGYLT